MQVARAAELTNCSSVTNGGELGYGDHCTNAPSSKSIWQSLSSPQIEARALGAGRDRLAQLDDPLVGVAALDPGYELPLLPVPTLPVAV